MYKTWRKKYTDTFIANQYVPKKLLWGIVVVPDMLADVINSSLLCKLYIYWYCIVSDGCYNCYFLSWKLSKQTAAVSSRDSSVSSECPVEKNEGFGLIMLFRFQGFLSLKESTS